MVPRPHSTIRAILGLALLLVVGVESFSQQQTSAVPRSFSTTQADDSSSETRVSLSLSQPAVTRTTEEPSRKRNCDPCDINSLNDDDDDSLDVSLDRREAMFALLGTLWATLPRSPAHAVYGTDAKLELPNPMEGMSNRVNKQCLVETLGNRECLVYMDDATKFLYQGADGQVLVTRVEKASSALASIPPLIETKKWSAVQGVMTGPMGELISTMGQLAKLSESKTDVLQSKIKSVKTDLYAIQAAVDRKDPTAALKAHTAATNDLVAFVKVL